MRIAPLASPIAALLALSAVACSAAHKADVERTYAEPEATRTLGEGARRQQVAGYVWLREGDATTTYTVAEDGAVLGRESGVAFMTSRGLVRTRTGEVTVKRSPCEYDKDGNDLPPSVRPRAAIKARFVSIQAPVGGVERLAGSDAPDASDYSNDGEILASAGPYVFVREARHSHWCGQAADDGTTTVSIYDLEGGVFVRMDPSTEEAEALRKRAAAIFAASKKELYEEPELTQTRIAYKDGKLAVTYQVSGVTCFDCGDKAYASFTVSTDLPAPTMPKELAPFAEPPAGVKAFLAARLAANPSAKLGGWSLPYGPRS